MSTWCIIMCVMFVFFFKQKTAYEMRISDWSSDVCSSDLPLDCFAALAMTVERGGVAVFSMTIEHGRLSPPVHAECGQRPCIEARTNLACADAVNAEAGAADTVHDPRR